MPNTVEPQAVIIISYMHTVYYALPYCIAYYDYDDGRFIIWNVYMSVTFIRVGPQGYFTHISITTPIVSALKNYTVLSRAF